MRTGRGENDEQRDKEIEGGTTKKDSMNLRHR